MINGGILQFQKMSLFSFLGSVFVPLLDNKISKSKVSKAFILILLSLLSLTCFAQETHNLEIIWTIPGNPVLYGFGVTMAGGDIDNDGHQDIIVSADTFDENGGTTPYYGRAYLYYGNQIGDTTPDVVFKSPFAKGTTPTCVHSADLNGDNYDDIIMGEDQADEGYGGVTIFWGGNPVNTVPDVILHGRSVRGAFFGCGVSSGDINGDSFADLIVGASGTSNFKGRVYIYYGGPNFDTIPDVILNGGHNNDQESFGSTVGSSGNVNNDGFDDIIIGARTFGPSIKGRIYIYFGSYQIDTIYDVAMSGEVPNQSLGWTPMVNLLKTELEYDMAVFGSEFWPYGFPRVGPGKLYVLFGGNPMDSIPDVWMIGRTDSTGLGVAVSNAGFVNQTNSEGINAGAPQEYNSFGSTYLWLGGALLDTTPDAWLRGVQYDDGIGWYVASAGDVNNDERDEIMVSNYASNYTPKRVWVCKYTGPGIEENGTLNALRLTPEIIPNPAKSMIRIRCPVSGKRIRVYDITGKIVKVFDITKIPESGQYEIRWNLYDNNKKKVATGIYFIEIKTEDDKSEIKKITVVK
jgi:FG-GAP repeat/Secretion system C-terminal sorting domain/FG-GAP-like repeat